MLKFSVKKNDFLNPLSKIQTIIDKKTSMTIINNVLIYTDENYLFVEATDLEISYKSKIPCSVTEQGAITINARKFYEIVKEFPSEEIFFEEYKDTWLKIGADEKAEYKIGGIAPDDFPKFRHISRENAVDLESSIIREMIEKTIFSSSYDDRKYSLSGIYFEEENDDEGKSQIRMVSSDGHRLSLMEKNITEKGLRLEQGVIIPKKGAQEIRKIIEGHERMIWGFDNNFCFVKCNNDHLVVRLVEGKFPDYRNIIPKSRDRYLTFNRLEVFNTLKRISIFSSDTTFRGVKASVKPKLIEIESLYKEIGEAKETINIDYSGEPFEIAFNAKYLMDALSVMDSDRVELTANNSESPCLLTGKEDIGFLGLIMPMNLVKE
ncbi:MAG: DNA polymerase III subunit beta [Dissulfuribacterales bacterium]